MTLVHPYCSVADVRAQMGDVDGKLDQTLIEKAISATSRAIDKCCGRRFWQDAAPAARLYEVDGDDTIIVNDFATKAGLVVSTDIAGDGTFATTWQASDYWVGPLNADADGDAFAWSELTTTGRLYFPAGPGPRVRVTAQWGWSVIPDGVSEAAIIKAVSLFKRKDAPQGLAGFGEFGVVRIGRYDPDVLELLRPFKRPVIA